MWTKETKPHVQSKNRQGYKNNRLVNASIPETVNDNWFNNAPQVTLNIKLLILSMPDMVDDDKGLSPKKPPWWTDGRFVDKINDVYGLIV